MKTRLTSSILAISLTGLFLVIVYRNGGENSPQRYARASQSAQAALGDEGSLTIPSYVTQAVELSFSERYANHDRVDFSKLLRVYVGNSEDCCQNKNPIAGSYEVDNKSVRFIPKFDFVEGQDYVISVQHQSEDNGAFHKLTPFRIQPDTPVVKSEVTAVYPSGDILPENVLRFYIHFSTPMKPHVAFDYIKLVHRSIHSRG